MAEIAPPDTADLEPLIRGCVEVLAARLDGIVEHAATWFDGFWDFVVRDLDRAHQSKSLWQISGGRDEYAWAILLFTSPDPARSAFEAHLFVEAKDRRPNAEAPWPVSSILIGGDEPARQHPPDRFDRPHDEGIAAQLRAGGYDVFPGYWGVRCSRAVAWTDSDVPARVGEILSHLSEDLHAALALARSFG